MSVSDAWADLMSTLREKAPHTAESLLPPPSLEVVRSMEASTGLDWPDDLREYFSLHNGQADTPDPTGSIFPAQDMFGVERALAERAMMVSVWRELSESGFGPNALGYDAIVDGAPNAGSPAHAYLPQYVPLSGSDGYYYFCDVRGGPNRGCVRAFEHDVSDGTGPVWPSITAMLVGLRDNIRLETAADGWQPHTTKGFVAWYPAGVDPDTPRPTPVTTAVIHTGYDSPRDNLLGERRPDDPGADTQAIARAVVASASEKYGADRVTGAQTLIPWIPQAPGFVAGGMAIVDGAQVYYAAVVMDVPGQFQVHEILPEGARFER